LGAIPTIHPWAVPLTPDRSHTHPDRDPRAVKATGWRRQHAVLHRLSLFSVNSKADGSANLLRETPKAGGASQSTPTAPFHAKSPAHVSTPTPGLSCAGSHWISGELEGGCETAPLLL